MKIHPREKGRSKYVLIEETGWVSMQKDLHQKTPPLSVAEIDEHSVKTAVGKRPWTLEKPDENCSSNVKPDGNVEKTINKYL